MKMKIEDFYTFSSKLSSSTVQAHPVSIVNKETPGDLSDAHKLIKGNYTGISFPVVFKQVYGTKLKDILDTGWPSLFLISVKLKTILENNNLTGWKIYDVRVLDKKEEEIKGYLGFSITGKCGMIDYKKSKIIEKRLIPNGPQVKYYKGLYIGLDKWDNCDFFLPEKYFGIIATGKVSEVLGKNKITNIRFENLADLEMDEYSVKVALENVKRIG